MKKLFIFLFSISLVFSSFAKREYVNDAKNGNVEKQFKKHKDKVAAKEKKMHQRKIKLINQVLNQIGVSKEDQKKIHAIQAKYRKQMLANREKMSQARRELAQLQKQNASPAEIELAIQKVTKLFGDQLRMIVKNRRAMEKILGEEKYHQFMKQARKQMRKHMGEHKGMIDGKMQRRGRKKGPPSGRGGGHKGRGRSEQPKG